MEEKPKSENVNERKLPFVPLRDVVVFPYMLMPLFIGREKSILALNEATSAHNEIFLVAQRDPKTTDPLEKDLYPVGTIANIVQMIRMGDGNLKVLLEGKRRARIVELCGDLPYHCARVEEVGTAPREGREVEALCRSLHQSFENYCKANTKIPQEVLAAVTSIGDPERLADVVASYLPIKVAEKQALLELIDVEPRIEKVLELVQAEIGIAELEKRIRSRVKEQMEKSQKEYYLNEQMQAIQRELGEKDDFKNEIQELEERLKKKKKKMSAEACDRVSKEIKKMKMMTPMSAEATVVRNYIDWILALPWQDCADENKDLAASHKILEEDHYGMKEPKERILEYLAVRNLMGMEKNKGPILCLVGAPGVGKTSLGKSIARATGRKYVRLSLGGVRDEAEIRGHRRTYIGALPGKIIQSMRKVGAGNPVFLLDEVDKMSMDFRGDPSAALLEVLDPEQNCAFADHYLDLDYDLSRVMFIATANSLHAVPPALRDRMEIIEMSGYTEDEKLHIARQFLIKKEIKENGLKDAYIEFPDKTVKYLIQRYTHEAGVRNLERAIASICRKVAREVVKKGQAAGRVRVTLKRVCDYLGPEKFKYGVVEEKDEIGLVRGLAFTDYGGDLLDIEVSVVPGKGKLTVTGKLGEVMQESAQAAMSYVRSRTADCGFEEGFYQNIDIHIHVPEGAIPKDGPSAGIAMATAIMSALLKVPVSKSVAMSGEITLRGRVLPIGGLKEKVLAAHRGGVAKVVLPEENRKDLREIPKTILKDLTIVFVEQMDQVVREAFVVEGGLDAFLRKRCEERDSVKIKKMIETQKPPISPMPARPFH